MSDRTCTIEGCDKPHQARGWCKAHWTRWRRHGDPHAVLCGPGIIRVEEPTYYALHSRIKRSRGSASAYGCARCGERAAHWSYDHADEFTERVALIPFGSASVGLVTYSLDLDHYEPLCRSCHLKVDRYGHLRRIV